MAEVVLNDVSKSFGAEVAVDGLTMTIPDRAFVVLLGPTGAGKTTTLRLISGLEKADRGEIFIGGRNVDSKTPADIAISVAAELLRIRDAAEAAKPDNDDVHENVHVL